MREQEATKSGENPIKMATSEEGTRGIVRFLRPLSEGEPVVL